MSERYRVAVTDQREYQVEVEADSIDEAITQGMKAHRRDESTLEASNIIGIDVVRMRVLGT